MALVSTIAKPMVAIIGARCGAPRARSGAKIHRSRIQPAAPVTIMARKIPASNGSRSATTEYKAA